MSELRTFISMGFEKGATASEACEKRGYVVESEVVDGNVTTLATQQGTVQTLACEDGRFLLFRLVEEGAGNDEYIPSAKPPRKPRSDRGKPRKKKE